MAYLSAKKPRKIKPVLVAEPACIEGDKPAIIKLITLAELVSAKKELEDHDILSRETAAGYMSNLSFWWASTSTDYYLSYLDRTNSVSASDIQTFIEEYLANKNLLTTIWINSEDNKKHKITEKISMITNSEKASQ